MDFLFPPKEICNSVKFHAKEKVGLDVFQTIKSQYIYIP
jgi:hypothetical protein